MIPGKLWKYYEKIWVIWNLYYWYYEEILERFSEIISVKFRKNYKEILEKS